MPTALSTTKRKFHKILDSISNASSTTLTPPTKSNISTSTLPSSFESPAKKARLVRPTSAFVRPNTTSPFLGVTSTGRPASATASVKNRTPATISEEHEPPNFAPWDRRLFLKRLETYRHVDKWMGKPDKISEVQWAKRGWVCVNRETVRCKGGCEKEVVILLETPSAEVEKDVEDREEDGEEDDEDWREKAQEELVDKYAEMIANAHEPGCLWRSRGCDDTIYRLPLTHQATALEGLQQRYKSLAAMASDLPSVLSYPESLDVSKFNEQLTSLLLQPTQESFNESASTSTKSQDESVDKETQVPSINVSALTLALFGWQAEDNHIKGLATCTACFRRLGLWLFKSASDSSDPSMDRLDVLGEHRDYCPWVNAVSQNGNTDRRSSFEGLAGWEILLKAMKSSRSHKRDISPTKTLNGPVSGDLDTASEIVSIASTTAVADDQVSREEKDKERWAKLKKLRQVFNVKKKTEASKK